MGEASADLAFQRARKFPFLAPRGAGALRKAGAAVGNLAAWCAAACIACAGRVPRRVARGPGFCSGARSGPLGGTKKRDRRRNPNFGSFSFFVSLYGFLLLSLAFSGSLVLSRASLWRIPLLLLFVCSVWFYRSRSRSRSRSLALDFASDCVFYGCAISLEV